MKSAYTIIDGIPCYAPDVAHENTDYPHGHFEKLFSIERKNFWFCSRNRVIQYLFQKYLGARDTHKVLEIGCGTGFVLHGLSRFSEYELTGAELHLAGLAFAKKRLHHVHFIQMDFRSTPFREEFDAIGAFDVLEHVEEDELMMKNAYTTLKPEGFFFISVPQHMWLWSTQDDAAYHKRRYSRKELMCKLKKAGFSVKFVTSFVFTLLPAMALSRFLKRNKPGKVLPKGMEFSYHELELPWVLNAALSICMRLDEFLIRLGCSLPIGGSLIAVAQKKKNDTLHLEK